MNDFTWSSLRPQRDHVVSLDEEDLVGNHCRYGWGIHYVTAYDRGHTRQLDFADHDRLKDWMMTDEGTAVARRILDLGGAANAIAVTYDSNELYYHPLIVHHFLCSGAGPTPNHRWTIIGWVVRLCILSNEHAKIDNCLIVDMESKMLTSDPKVRDCVEAAMQSGGADLLPGEIASGYRDHPLHDDPLAWRLRAIICDPSTPLQPGQREYFTNACIDLVLSWQRGGFDDVDNMREETYIEGMLNTIFSRGEMPE